MNRFLWLLVALALAVTACSPSDDGGSRISLPTTTEAGSGASTTNTPDGAYTPVFEQDTCRFAEPPGREIACGFVTVPEDRSNPGGNRVRIAVAIVKAEVGPTADDPIIYLDGGPGGESLEPLQFTFPQVFEPFAQTRDLVFFDQRGIGLSEPTLECTEDLDLTYELLDQDLPNARFLERQLEVVQQCRDRLVADGIDLSMYNSATNAADVADIRIALGYDEVNLLGISYGTRLAQTVMRDHPEGIRSVVLDSVYTPDVDLTASTPANLDRALDELFAGCAESTECAELFPDLEERLFALIEELEADPVTVEATDFINNDQYDVIVDGSGLLGVVFQGLYSEQLIPVLPQLVDELERSSDATLAQLVSINLSNVPFLSLGMHLSVQCAEEIPFADPTEVAAADDPYPEFIDFFDVSPNLGPVVFDLCDIWDVEPLGSVENEPISSQIPTLVLAGQYDPITTAGVVGASHPHPPQLPLPVGEGAGSRRQPGVGLHRPGESRLHREPHGIAGYVLCRRPAATRLDRDAGRRRELRAGRDRGCDVRHRSHHAAARYLGGALRAVGCLPPRRHRRRSDIVAGASVSAGAHRRGHRRPVRRGTGR